MSPDVNVSGAGTQTHLPLTVGTAGHVDHGKTALVRALTGVDTDRLPAERERGISIALGYAPLDLPSGRRLSMVDVPGHERFVRTMVAGATGIDLYLMVIAADDGVMPQTREHVAVLHALGVHAGVVAITKSDLLDPSPAMADTARLLPDVPAVAVSAQTRAGLQGLLSALDAVARALPSRADTPGPALLHVDRAFTIRGAGTVVTGTLAAGTIGRGDVLRVLPRDYAARVRGVQVHDRELERASAGQRVAVNLTGVRLEQVGRSDVLVGESSKLQAVTVLDVDSALELHGQRVHVHHGTLETPARARRLDGRLQRLRLERPLMACPGDRLVIRAVAPPTTLGGAVVVAAHTAARGARPRAASTPVAAAPRAAARTAPAELDQAALALEQRLLEAAHEPPLDKELDGGALARLRASGRAVRVGPALHFHPEALGVVEDRIRAIIEREGEITLARLRDELDTSRKFAQALLEHFDGAKVTVRRGDNSRVLRRRSTQPR
jgi:selenocysteine-specific elongation factor